MNRFDWNNLHPGDQVVVHHPAFPVQPSTAGAVVRVTVRSRGLNEVTVRLDGPHGAVVVPPITTVHRRHLADDDCWRCDELERSAQ